MFGDKKSYTLDIDDLDDEFKEELFNQRIESETPGAESRLATNTPETLFDLRAVTGRTMFD